MLYMLPALVCLASPGLPVESPDAHLAVGLEVPASFDLRAINASHYLPSDPRDPQQVEATRQAWGLLIQEKKDLPALRLYLPRGPQRLPLLLAASQALKAQNPNQKLYLAYDPGMTALWDESAWGALDGGAMLSEDLGPDPDQWEKSLVKAQELFPGRPWRLWMPCDPGVMASVLLGGGAKLVVPLGGPTAQLASMLPGDFSEVEGGRGDLTLRHPEKGESKRWRLEGNTWKEAAVEQDRHEVSVNDKANYDVGGLLARMRATQLRDRAALQNCQSRLDVDIHGAVGYTFQAFEKNGESEELLQKEVRLGGVRANLKGGEQLPQFEARTSMAAPVALSLTERFRYRDGGEGKRSGTRRLIFEPVDGNSQMPKGELLVEERSGRVLEERSRRSDLPGMVKSEEREIVYGEPAPGYWRVVKINTFERWLGSGGVGQIQRRLIYQDFKVNSDAFEANRQEARESKGTMLKSTVDGLRYFNVKDGVRQVETHPKSSGKFLGLGGDAQMPIPLPIFQYFNFNAFDKGVQFNFMTAIVLNQLSLAVPGLPGGFDFSADLEVLAIPQSERPVQDGKELDRDGVKRMKGDASIGLGRDLGLGFRLEGKGLFQYNRFSELTGDDKKYKTVGYVLPESGLTREWRGILSWQRSGFSLGGFYGRGQRPNGIYGTPTQRTLFRIRDALSDGAERPPTPIISRGIGGSRAAWITSAAKALIASTPLGGISMASRRASPRIAWEREAWR